MVSFLLHLLYRMTKLRFPKDYQLLGIYIKHSDLELFCHKMLNFDSEDFKAPQNLGRVQASEGMFCSIVSDRKPVVICI